MTLPSIPSWTTPDATLTGKIESAQGMLAERFAFCQTMPLDEFLKIAEALRPSGYRPTRFRPYAEGKNLRVAAVWTRDGRPWRLAHDQSADEIRQTDERNRKEGYLPVDVAGYLAAGGDDGKPTSRFAALWAQRTGPDDDARMVLASSVAELTKVQEQLKNAGLVPLTLHAWRQADDKLSYSGVWHKTATGTSDTASFQNGLSEADLPGVVAQQSGSLIDLDLAAAPPPPSTKERAASALQAAEAALKAKPDDLNARFARAIGSLPAWREPESDRRPQCRDREGPAGRPSPISTVPSPTPGWVTRTRQGRIWSKFQKGKSTESTRLYLAVIVAAELGEGTDQALETLEAALKKQPQDSELHYDAACAYALASQAVARKDQAKSQVAVRASPQPAPQGDRERLRRLQAHAGGRRPRPAARTPGVCRHHEGRASGPLLRRRLDGRFPVRGESPPRSRSDRSPPAVPGTGVAGLSHGRPLGRPDFPRGTADHRLGLAPPGDHGRDQGPTGGTSSSGGSRPASHGEGGGSLAPAAAQCRPPAAELHRQLAQPSWSRPQDSLPPNWTDRPATAKPTPAQGQQFMDAILFHPETSQRRALILALGTYGTEGLSPGEREPLIGKLLDLYRNDPDSGIHGAAEWTLRQWKQQEKLKELDAELMKLKDWGDRRWFVNSQGQTFAVIEGPVEFRMGSPPTEPDRIAGNETPRRVVIPRRFAIADQGGHGRAISDAS